jgi:Tol biopolymer transport system component
MGKTCMNDAAVAVRALSCAAFVLAAASCGGSYDSPNGPPALRNSIVFVSDRSGADEIYVMNADGSNVREIPTIEGQKAYPVVSPDGRKIVFTVGPLQAGGTSSLYVVSADGAHPTRLTSEPGLDELPTWSGDGAHIAFVSTRDGNDEIYVMNADGTGQTNLTNNAANDFRPSWSPAANAILFESDRDGLGGGQGMIYTMTAAGASPTPLIAGSNPEWSPSGSSFLFKRSGQLWVSATPDGSSVTQITTVPAFYFNPRWSPDASRIAFSNLVNDHEEIWTVNAADGSGALQLTPDAQGESYYPSWTRH